MHTHYKACIQSYIAYYACSQEGCYYNKDFWAGVTFFHINAYKYNLPLLNSHYPFCLLLVSFDACQINNIDHFLSWQWDQQQTQHAPLKHDNMLVVSMYTYFVFHLLADKLFSFFSLKNSTINYSFWELGVHCFYLLF